MARFWGIVGLNRGTQEVAPGILKEVIEEVEVKGDIYLNRGSWPNAGARTGISVNHVLSVVTPEDSDLELTEAVYVIWQKRKWAVQSIAFKRPRVDLTLGGLYNG